MGFDSFDLRAEEPCKVIWLTFPSLLATQFEKAKDFLNFFVRDF